MPTAWNIVLFAGVLYILLATSAIGQAPASNTKISADTLDATSDSASPWKLVWSDDFDIDGTPNPSKWDFERNFVRNNEAQLYTDRVQNARVEKGMLVIEAHKEELPNPDFDPTSRRWQKNWKSARYSSACVHSKTRAAWAYGRFEVRAKLPTGRGTWPAIWMLGTNMDQVGWPKCGEIDILENVGFAPNTIHANVHSEKYNHIRGNGKGSQFTVNRPSEDFHIYALEWTPSRLDFFCDGTKYFTYTKKAGATVDSWPFDRPHYLLLNLAVGGAWGGQEGIDDAIFPQQFLIDYVRVYRHSTAGIQTTRDTETGWDVHSLSHGNTTVKIAPDAGCNAFSMQVEGTEYFHPPASLKDVPGVRCGNPILYPTPNRVRDGAFQHEGQTIRFQPPGKGNHIHGLVNRHPWNVESSVATSDSVELTCVAHFEKGSRLYELFPFEHTLRMKIRVSEGAVRWTYEVDNRRGNRSVPFGIGFHPYFTYLDDRRATYLTIPATRIMMAQDMLPNGKLLELDGHALDARTAVPLRGYQADNVFFGISPERPASIEYRQSRRRMVLHTSEDFTHVVVWTPQRPYFSVENQTCSTDAHNLHAQGRHEAAHLQHCPAGEQRTGFVEYVVTPVP